MKFHLAHSRRAEGVCITRFKYTHQASVNGFGLNLVINFWRNQQGNKSPLILSRMLKWFAYTSFWSLLIEYHHVKQLSTIFEVLLREFTNGL